MKRILVIDDEESIRRAFELALEDKEDISCDTANSGTEGLEKLKKEKYDLVFLDLSMPEMNGVETLKAIHAEIGDVPICILTAYYQKFLEDLREAENLGIKYSLQNKPLGLLQIEAVVKEYLENSPGES